MTGLVDDRFFWAAAAGATALARLAYLDPTKESVPETVFKFYGPLTVICGVLASQTPRLRRFQQLDLDPRATRLGVSAVASALSLAGLTYFFGPHAIPDHPQSTILIALCNGYLAHRLARQMEVSSSDSLESIGEASEKTQFEKCLLYHMQTASRAVAGIQKDLHVKVHCLNTLESIWGDSLQVVTQLGIYLLLKNSQVSWSITPKEFVKFAFSFPYKPQGHLHFQWEQETCDMTPVTDFKNLREPLIAIREKMAKLTPEEHSQLTFRLTKGTEENGTENVEVVKKLISDRWSSLNQQLQGMPGWNKVYVFDNRQSLHCAACTKGTGCNQDAAAPDSK